MSTEKVKAALALYGELSAVELQSITDYCRSSVNDKLRKLIADKEVHVSGYRPQVGVQGCPTPVYSIGTKKARKPKAVKSDLNIARSQLGVWAGLMQ